MKLIIEINENEYEGIKSFPNANTSYPWTLHLYDAVRNGIPLKDIKAEIKFLIDAPGGSYDFHAGLGRALMIIDKHISGKDKDV